MPRAAGRFWKRLKAFGILLVRERLQGICLTVYRDGQPDELFFMGTSGD